MKTAYNIQQIVENERGWLFYEAAMKNWKAVNSFLLGDSILDIGCGSGISMALSKVFNPQMSFVGFEGNDSASEIWAARQLTVNVGDIYNLPFDNKSFDTVYSSHVLEHLEEPSKVIDESIRVAKRRIIHSVPNGDVDDKNFGSPHLNYFDRVNYKSLFKYETLSIVSYFNVNDIHMSSLVIVADLV